jgi:hypothetical protein
VIPAITLGEAEEEQGLRPLVVAEMEGAETPKQTEPLTRAVAEADRTLEELPVRELQEL